MSEFIKAIGIFYKNELNAIKKSGVQLQPVCEAFSNVWESIEERSHGELMRHGRIRMEFHYIMGLFKNDAENRLQVFWRNMPGYSLLLVWKNLQVSVKHNSVTICMADASRAEGLLIRFRKE